MKILMSKIELQSVVCIKDNKLYVYKIDENPYFLEEDYTLIKCFNVDTNGEPDFSKEIEIYGKDLINPIEEIKHAS